MAIGSCLIGLLCLPFAAVYKLIKPSTGVMIGIIITIIASILFMAIARKDKIISDRLIAIVLIISVAAIFGLLKYVGLF